MMTNSAQIVFARSAAACRLGQTLAAAIVLLVGCLSGWAVGSEPLAATTVGMEGTCFLPYDGPAIEAKEVDDSAPLVVRISPVTSDDQAAGYELHYIATRPGTYDLRDWLVRIDGRPLADIAPLRVKVVSVLPADDDGTLASSRGPALPWFWPYRWLLVAGVAIWLGPIVWGAVRMFRRRPLQPAASQSVPLALADQLRPLIAAALAGRLDSEDLARLELLLHRHWRRRLALEGCSADECLQKMRKHPDAGRLLSQLEEWLYKPPARQPADVAAILLPYQDQAALDWSDDYLVAAGRFPATLSRER